MILIVSDIHLADTTERFTVDLKNLCATIRSEAARAKANKYPFKVLLLGDIFELLKSQVWHAKNLRPWEDCSDKHIAAVTEIFERIIAVNGDFFHLLTSLDEVDGTSAVVYVPGNHDWPINSDMGGRARVRFAEVAGLKRTDHQRRFSPVFSDKEHSLIARHGHEHDPANRTEAGKISLGDAIVIEVLLGLPELVANELKCKSNDSKLEFLHELDNVRPQSVEAMASWLFLGARKLGGSTVVAALPNAIRQVVERLKALRKLDNASKAWERGASWIDTLLAVGDLLLERKNILELAAQYGPRDGEDPFADHAFQDLSRVFKTGKAERFRHIAYGHTHLPEHIPLALDWEGDGTPSVYLNTGTWRRVHRFGRRMDKSPYFASFKEETYVILYRKGEHELDVPSYEFRRTVRG